MRRAIYKRGIETGAPFKKYAPNDMKGLCKAFLDFIPDPDHTFKPELVRCDDQEVEIKFHGCPLKDAWQEMGLADRVRLADRPRVHPGTTLEEDLRLIWDNNKDLYLKAATYIYPTDRGLTVEQEAAEIAALARGGSAPSGTAAIQAIHR